VYIDPVTQQPVDQNHGGANGLLNDGRSCTDCHTAATVGEPAPSLFDAGSMEALAPQRGGVNTPTPIPEPFAMALQLAALGALAVVSRRRR
jgi:MYXO-CTERM domain-containing protein